MIEQKKTLRKPILTFLACLGVSRKYVKNIIINHQRKSCTIPTGINSDIMDIFSLNKGPYATYLTVHQYKYAVISFILRPNV